MDTFFSSTSHNFTLDETQSFDDISQKINRSKLLLNEMTAESKSLIKPLNHSQLQSTARRSQSMLRPITQQQQQHSDQFLNEQSSIYTQFKMDTNKFIDEELNLAELLRSYSNVCKEHVQFLNEKVHYLKMNRQKQELLKSTLNEQEELDKEKNLWHLLYLLYSDEQQNSRECETMMNDDEEKENELADERKIGFNEAVLIERLEKKNSLFRRVKLIVKWLEKISAESNSLRLIEEKIGEFPEKCLSWEHTLHQLKNVNSFNKKEKTAQFSSREFVDELDPDAPIRQNKPLHDLDQEDEYKLMEYIYSYIRAGDLNSARDLCFKMGQSWRAATLEGFKLYKDKNYLAKEQNRFDSNKEMYLNEGNFNRDIWKLMVYRLIKDEHFSAYEKAAYASLAGFAGPVLPVCRTYMDFVWVYFKALYNHLIQIEIKEKTSSLREFTSIPYDNDEDYLFNNLSKSSSNADNSFIIAQIFERIKVLINNSGVSSIATSNMMEKSLIMSGQASNPGLSVSAQLVNNLKTDAQKPFSVVLKHVIMSGINGFKQGTNELMEFLKTSLNASPQNGILLRLSSHIALFYRTASFDIKKETFNEIIDSYVNFLIENNYNQTIAYYLSYMPSDTQIKRYSKFLQKISDSKERQTLLKLAKERNMNVQAITLNIVDNLSKTSPTKSAGWAGGFGADSTGLSTSLFIGKTAEIFTSGTGQILTDEDKSRINAIDWIVYDQTQRLQLLEYANMSMRYFLLERKNFEATKSVYSKIPQDTLSTILSRYNVTKSAGAHLFNVEANFQQIIDNLPINVVNVIKEFLCFKEYVESVNFYNDWLDYYHKEKPVKPVSKLDTSDSADKGNIFAERIAYDYQLKQYKDLLDRWSSKSKLYCDKVRLKFVSLLKFPFGGWMVDVPDEAEGSQEGEENVSSEDTEMNMDENDGDTLMVNEESKNEAKKRSTQMKGLRKFYLPNICFVLVDMYSKMSMNKDLIRLSDLIACENFKIYQLFEQKQLKVFLNRVCDASISLLDENVDYLGYNN